MKIVGLTGGIACGKSMLASMFKELGATVIDADEISRQLSAPGGEALPSIREAFGGFVFYPDGSLNREVLAELVFQNDEERQRLNNLMHPLIDRKVREKINTCRKMGTLVVVLDVPLLFEVGVDALADVTVCASAPQEMQIQRLYTRSGLNEEQALHRIHSQMKLEDKEKLANIVIHTDCPVEELRKEAQRLYREWTA
ncbi:MAG: dephospho-CoA kinase [Eubacteriales bacterium]|nr:dephospho-CoA kinase [Eubacteriales bacterium]